MKTKQLLYGMLLCGSMSALSSCTSTEPTYEEVDVIDKTLFYITGRVEANGAPAAGVTVSTPGLQAVTTDENGIYLIESTEAGREYLLTFSAPGFAETKQLLTLPGTMKSSEAVVKNIILAEQGTAVSLKQNSQEYLVELTSDVSMLIPGNAVTANQDLYVGQGGAASGHDALAVSEIYSSSTASLQTPGTLIFKNKTSNSVAFEGAELFALNPNTFAWEKSSDVTFSKEENAYTSQVLQLRSYQLRPTHSIEKGEVVETDVVNATEEVNNIGQLKAQMNVSFWIKRHIGWGYLVTPAQAVEEAIPSISESDKAGLVAYIEAMIKNYAGCEEGTYQLPRMTYVNVSGNAHLVYTNKAEQQDITFNIPVVCNNQTVTVSVKVQKYIGERASWTFVPGSSHSGGGLN